MAVKRTSQSRSDGVMMRLRSESFWRKKINLIADEHREHQAMRRRQLGDQQLGLMPYCSDQTIALMETRRADIAYKMKRSTHGTACGLTKAEIFANSERSRFNQLFLTLKAMDKLASHRDYQWALITLTCPPRFHPTSATYEGLSMKAGHEYLNNQFRKITKHLDKKYKANRDYFGIRVVEVHKDGCPHWHILLYGSAMTLAFCREKLERLHIGDGRPDGYFDEHHSEIFKTQAAQELRTSPVSYVLKYLYPRRTRAAISVIDTATRVRCALRAAGIPQHKLIGAEGVSTKARILRQVATATHAPPNLRKLAKTLVTPSEAEGESEGRMQAMVDLLDHTAREIQVIRSNCLNRYREPTTKISHMKHTQDCNMYQLGRGFLSTRWWGAVTVKVSSKVDRIDCYPDSLLCRVYGNYYLAMHKIIQCNYLQYPPARLCWRPPWQKSKAQKPTTKNRKSFLSLSYRSLDIIQES